MRYVIAQSFEKSEVNHFFRSDMIPKIGRSIKTKKGKWYRIMDIGWVVGEFDKRPDIRVFLQRIE